MNIQDPKQIIKIVAIGPESTGKSTLCATLAKYFSTIWCKEYAREYLLEHGTAYSYQDLLTIAEGQLKLEDEATAEAIALHKQAGAPGLPILFIDTDMQVMKVWCEFVFGNCHPFILNKIVQQKYDGYLLCKPDLPWIKDELREYPDMETRDKLYHHYKDILINQSLPWYEVNGQNPARSQSAIEWIKSMLK
jgi:NadR type nicotinamide-nucleotide adenylyltransferase